MYAKSENLKLLPFLANNDGILPTIVSNKL
jgi:hypothetical protein